MQTAPTGSNHTLEAKSSGLALLLLIPIKAGIIVVGVEAKIPPLTPPSLSTTKVANAAMQPARNADAKEVKIARSPNLEAIGKIVGNDVQGRPFI